ncbi:hypothetical protein [Neobacillus sp. SuZ13]|uniref:hypothetical protein n=1 Tax=Neobacillus sp. SuZ13 TaxID=3047875 RepID=UPI0024BFC76E|nr:hypothetical protein [Neobacillus sp. SuZ13]WHY64699.1 hypothetical protein QNH17_16360 [Neobacillus sp. SuZ13]
MKTTIKLINGRLTVIETKEPEPILQTNLDTTESHEDTKVEETVSNITFQDGNYHLNIGAYDKRLCPHCNYKFEKEVTRKRKCPECKNTILVKTNYELKKKMLLKEEQLDNYEKALSNYWRKQGEDRKKQWITNFFKAHGTTYEEEKRKSSSGSSNPYDIAWGMLNGIASEKAVEMQWGLFRNVRISMGDLLKQEGKLEKALFFYLEVCYLDINGATNTTNRPKLLEEYPPFRPQDGQLFPGIVHYVEEISHELNLSIKDIKVKFIEHNNRLYKGNSLVPLSADKAWVSLEKELLVRNN